MPSNKNSKQPGFFKARRQAQQIYKDALNEEGASASDVADLKPPSLWQALRNLVRPTNDGFVAHSSVAPEQQAPASVAPAPAPQMPSYTSPRQRSPRMGAERMAGIPQMAPPLQQVSLMSATINTGTPTEQYVLKTNNFNTRGEALQAMQALAAADRASGNRIDFIGRGAHLHEASKEPGKFSIAIPMKPAEKANLVALMQDAYAKAVSAPAPMLAAAMNNAQPPRPPARV